MTRVDQGDAGQVGESYADVTGVRVMAVDDPWPTGFDVQEGGQIVHESVEVVPKLLFGDVAFRSRVDPDDARLIVQCLDGLCIIRADGRIDHPPGDKIDS